MAFTDNDSFAKNPEASLVAGGAKEGTPPVRGTEARGLDVQEQPQRREGPPVAEENWLDPDELAALQEHNPNAARELKRRFREVADLKKKLDKSDDRFTSLQEQMVELQRQLVNGNANNKQRGTWDEITDDQLEDYVARADKLLVAMATDPENEEIKNEVAKISVDRLHAVKKELRKRERDEDFGKLREEWGAGQRASQLDRATENYLLKTFGANELMDDGDGSLKSAAREKLNSISKNFGMSLSDIGNMPPEAQSMVSVLAMQLANAEKQDNRDRDDRFSASIRRGLDLGEQSSRASAVTSSRSVALARGDKEAVWKHDLDAFFDANGIG